MDENQAETKRVLDRIIELAKCVIVDIDTWHNSDAIEVPVQHVLRLYLAIAEYEETGQLSRGASSEQFPAFKRDYLCQKCFKELAKA